MVTACSRWPRTRARATSTSGTPTAAACGNNDQWWTYHHDEWNTGDYRRDTRAPDRVLSLAASSTAVEQVDVDWTAPGDDGACGQAGSYQLAWSTSPLTPANFDQANPVSAPAPQAAGAAQSASFAAPQNHIFVGLRARDEAGNPGRLSVVTVNVLPEPAAELGWLAGAVALATLRRRRCRSS